jgi:hypothetical protein
MVHGSDVEPLAAAQRVIDALRRPTPHDAHLVAAMLRLRGISVADDDADRIVRGLDSGLSPVTQEHRLVRGVQSGLNLVRGRAQAGWPPDGWFCVELFRAMTAELPRFRNNDLRRGPPWDAQMHVTYPAPDQLRLLLDTFDASHAYRDMPVVFNALHPIRQGFRLFWRLARIAPFPDFNVVIAWLAMNTWLQAKGFPLLAPDACDAQLIHKLVSGPPPTKIVPFEARLLAALGEAA